MRVADSSAARRTIFWRVSSFAPTMAFGILAIAARTQGLPQLAIALLLIALLLFVISLVRNAGAVLSAVDTDKATPVLVLFTWVAACGVLSQQLPSARWAFAVLGAAGFGGALIALARAVRSPGRPAPEDVTGSWLLAAVAVQSLSIMCGSLGGGAFSAGAIGLWAAGLVIYLLVIALILRQLVRREVGLGELTPDYWIAMGALAISTVSATQARPPARFAPVVWVAAGAWVPYLCVVEAVRLKRGGVAVRYDLLRWSTVFPLGMFSVATHDLGFSKLEPVAAAFLWIGLAVALWNVIAAARHLLPARAC